jgi:hypothetical protein
LWETLTPHYHQQIGHPNKKINKEILDVKYTIDHMDLVDVYRTFHPTSTQHRFFSAAQRTFSKIDHILGHKAASANIRK